MAFNLKKFLGGSDISSEDEYYTLSVEDNVVYVYKKMLQHIIIVKINILLEYVKNVLINQMLKDVQCVDKNLKKNFHME